MKTIIRQPAKKNKILFVITQGEMGGAQRYVFDLTTHLDKNRYEVLVAVGKENSALRQRLEQNSIGIETIPHLVRDIHPFYDLLAVWELEQLIKKFQPDVVHLNSSKAGVIGSLAARLARRSPNVIFTAHGFAFLEPHNFIVRLIYFWSEKFASRFRQKIITVSEYDRQAAINSGLCAPEKLVTIHNGIRLENLSSTTNYQLPTTHSVIGTLAHDYPTKDLKTLRSAFQILKKEFPNLKLKIIGRGSQVGEVENAENLLAEFDIYVCSSIKEGFPYSILEAMASGLPIISTAVGGIPEMLGAFPSPGVGRVPKAGEVERTFKIDEGSTCGLLVPPRNPPALASAIKQLLLNPELAKKLGNAARERVKQFSLEKMLTETEQIYQLLTTISHTPRASRFQ